LLSAGAAALALALLIPVSLVVMQTQSETELLTQELAVMDEHLRDLVKTKAPLENLELEVDRLREERREVLGAGGRFADRLDVVLGRLPESMAPDSVKMTGDAMIVEGEAERFSQVIDFAAQMENVGLFSAVYLESLTSLEASESGFGAAFRIRAEY
jgi:Tfp pilus assembly protein PilN